jgi:type II secretory pathway pseudopilin PulG
MAALLIGLSIMAVLMSAALPVWSHYAKREKEAELIWRGQQYARAIGLFQRKYANTFPPNIDILVEQRFLRKKYKDPMTNEDFQPIPAGGMSGVGVPPTGGVGGAGAGAGGRGAGSGGAMSGAGGAAQPSLVQERNARPVAGGTQLTLTGGASQPSVGIQGVVSKSKNASVKVYNGRSKYNEWMFVYLATAQRIGPVGVPGQPGQPPGGMQRGGAGMNPIGGSDRRPGIGMPPVGPGEQPRQPPPFGQPPFGQPPSGQSPFGRPPSGSGPPRPPGG